jgi:ComF family protein
MKLIDSLLSVISPYDCLGCAAEGALLCADCRGGLTPALPRCYRCHAVSASFTTCPACRPESPLRVVMPAVRYDGLAKDIVWRMKFARTQGAAAEIARLVEDRLQLRRRLHGRPDIIITHAPTATVRVRQRGYDQASLIAHELAGITRLPYIPLLARRGSQKQIGATKEQRTQQLDGAFRAMRAGRIRGKHIILIDDVVTTGATLEAAANALLQAGARRVDAVVFAQA